MTEIEIVSIYSGQETLTKEVNWARDKSSLILILLHFSTQGLEKATGNVFQHF